MPAILPDAEAAWLVDRIGTVRRYTTAGKAWRIETLAARAAVTPAHELNCTLGGGRFALSSAKIQGRNRPDRQASQSPHPVLFTPTRFAVDRRTAERRAGCARRPIELWPIDRLRPYAIDPVSGDLFIALNGSDRTTWNPIRRGHPADQV
jgi:hypothetical protein